MICPYCNLYEMTPIWYGQPGIDEIMLAREDKLVLGGLYFRGCTHYCHYCQETYPLKESSD